MITTVNELKQVRKETSSKWRYKGFPIVGHENKAFIAARRECMVAIKVAKQNERKQ